MKKYIALLLIYLISLPTMAFHLNPANRQPANINHHDSLLDVISENVHERITSEGRNIFLKECETANDKSGCKYEKDLASGSLIQDSLIRGVWWNDDPNQDLYKGRQIIWIGHMHDAERRAKKGVDINGDYMMQYRSHYGDMQFLHSMASRDGENAEETKAKILMWAEFAYKISTNEIASESTFSDVNISNLSRYFKRQSKWKIKWILQPRYFLTDTKNDFQEHALGTLLHMIEDSYSDSHIDRDHVGTPMCPQGRILSFHSYTNQRTTLHSNADTWKRYLSVEYPIGFSPADVTAKIIAFSHRKASWHDEVLPYLNNVVFCFDGAPEKSGPGRF